MSIHSSFKLDPEAAEAGSKETRPKLHAIGLCKAYGDAMALHPIDLKVRPGELLTLLGPSGSGKTTLLQLISGLVEPTDGRLMLDGRDQTDEPASRRDVGVVFQSYSLFPHMTVSDNVAFPLKMRRKTSDEIRKAVGDALDMVGLTGFDKRFPSELSGGQQQRVALARCLVYRPSLILMDESLSALDRKLREQMQIEIKRIHRETGSTIIFVTHDQEEALALSDRICLMNHGRVAQIGTPTHIYDEPESAFVADFIGISNIFSGELLSPGTMRSADGELPAPAAATCGAGSKVNLVIRPEHLRFVEAGSELLTGKVIERIYAGAETRVMVALESGTVVTVRQPNGQPAARIGETVWLSWNTAHSRLLAA